MKILVIFNFVLIFLISCNSSDVKNAEQAIESDIDLLESVFDLTHFENNLDSVDLIRNTKCFYQNNKIFLEIDISDNPIADENLTKTFFSYNLASSLNEKNISIIDSIYMKIFYGKSTPEYYIYSANTKEVLNLINEFKLNQKLYKATQFIILNKFYLALYGLNRSLEEDENLMEYKTFFGLLKNVFSECNELGVHHDNIVALMAWTGFGVNDDMFEIVNYSLTLCSFYTFTYEKLEKLMEDYFEKKYKVDFEDSPKARFIGNEL
jgi:hypothetical protein